jgi:hypothetical protein
MERDLALTDDPSSRPLLTGLVAGRLGGWLGIGGNSLNHIEDLTLTRLVMANRHVAGPAAE